MVDLGFQSRQSGSRTHSPSHWVASRPDKHIYWHLPLLSPGLSTPVHWLIHSVRKERRTSVWKARLCYEHGLSKMGGKKWTMHKDSGGLGGSHGSLPLSAAPCFPPQRSAMLGCDRSCSCSRGPNVEDGKWYGVRSYLHLFYEDCTGTALSDDPEGPPVLCSRRQWPTLCWKVRPGEEQLL